MLVTQSRRSTWFPYSKGSTCGCRSRTHRLSFNFWSSRHISFVVIFIPGCFIHFRNETFTAARTKKWKVLENNTCITPNCGRCPSVESQFRWNFSIFYKLFIELREKIFHDNEAEKTLTLLPDMPQTIDDFIDIKILFNLHFDCHFWLKLWTMKKNKKKTNPTRDIL